MKLILVTIIISCSIFAYAQEKLSPLRNNPQIEQLLAKSPSGKYKYLIDTLELPFIDDFVINRQKLYRVTSKELLNPFPFDTILKDGDVFDTVKAMIDTVWNYVVQTTPIVQVVDSQPSEPFKIEIWKNAFSPELEKFKYFYPNHRLIFSNFGVDTVWLNPDTVFIGTPDTFYIVNDDYSLWLGKDVFINTTYAIDPPTAGIATFDGLDSLGHPYDIFNENAHGVADYLISKPINLENKNGVIFSFFHQGGGYGEPPNKKDSLVLEFYAPNQDKWYSQWNREGVDTNVFIYEEIPVLDSAYLQNGFKFRFKNYASLSGAFDHWHIDYVYIDENRTPSTELVVNDVAMKSMPTSFLANYTSVPYHHFTTNMMKTTDAFDVQIYFQSNIPPLKANYSVSTEFNNEIYSPLSQVTNVLPSTGIWSSSFSIGGEFSYPSLIEPTWFTNKRFLESNDNNAWNDTSYFYQFFDTYYAYDDGTPELAYSVVGANGKVAQQFELTSPDSLKAILMFVPEMQGQTSNNFNITVWADNAGIPDSEPLFVGDFINPKYQPSNQPIKFERYELNDALYLEAGKYYVGFTQSFEDQIFVGFDQNINNASKIFYNVGTGWLNTSFQGSLMIRPDFGYAKPTFIIDPFTSSVNSEEQQIVVYPNPANNILHIKGAFLKFEVYNLLGEKVLESNENFVSVDYLKSGIYLMRVIDNKGKLITKKITIQH